MRIGITYDLKRPLSPESIIDSEMDEEYDSPLTIEAISKALLEKGHEPVKLGNALELLGKIREAEVDFVFNIAEGSAGRNRESHVPSMLEIFKIPYSGSDPLSLGMALDKTVTKRIAFQAGIPTPRYLVLSSVAEAGIAGKRLVFPLIIKPAWEGSSKGIYNGSRVFDIYGLFKAAQLLFEKYPGHPIMAEEYIEGREVTVGLLGNSPMRVLGMMEILNKVSSGEDVFYSLETKRNWERLVDYSSPPDLPSITLKHLKYYSLLAWRHFNLRDVARVDFKISSNGRIYMLEINPLPGLSPEYSDLVIMARKNGMGYNELIGSILEAALSRYRSGRGEYLYEKV